jgi:hypothetical protein
MGRTWISKELGSRCDEVYIELYYKRSMQP